MTRPIDAEDLIRSWLASAAPTEAPDRVLAETFARTRAINRNHFVPWRLRSMANKSAMLAAGAVAAVAALAVAVALGGVIERPSGQGSSSSATPEPSASGSAIAGSSPTQAGSPATTPASPPATPSGPPATATGRLAFHATVAGNSDIYAANADGTARTRLTTDPAIETDPSWSPDGRLITFTRANRIWVMAADGTAVRQVTTSTDTADRYPSFHPDGERIVFGRAIGGESAEMRIVDLDGGNDSLLYSDPAHLEGYGRMIDDNELWTIRDRAAGGGLEVIVVDLTTTKVSLITDPSDGEESVFAVSPDRRLVAYQSDGSPSGIYVMAMDGSDAHAIIRSSGSGIRVAWTSDGTTVSFVDQGWIQLVRPDGTGQTRLIEGASVEWDPSR